MLLFSNFKVFSDGICVIYGKFDIAEKIALRVEFQFLVHGGFFNWYGDQKIKMFKKNSVSAKFLKNYAL